MSDQCNKCTKISPQKKAWETRRKNSKPQGSFCKTKTFNSPAKNEFRKKVVEAFGDKGSVLTLESPEMLFVDSMPNHEFTIFEINPKSYKKIVEANRPNVKDVFNTDISAARYMKGMFDYMFLDFCGTFETCYPSIVAIMDGVESCKKLALTFCLRGNKKQIEDSKFDMAFKVKTIFKNFDIIHAETYADGAPMVGFILGNQEFIKRTPEELVTNIFINRNNSRYTPIELKDMLEIHVWCQWFSYTTWGHSIYAPDKAGWNYTNEGIIYDGASSRFIVDDEKFEILFNNMPKTLHSKIHKLQENAPYREYKLWETDSISFLSERILGRYGSWVEDIIRLDSKFKKDYWCTDTIKDLFSNKEYWQGIQMHHKKEYHEFLSKRLGTHNLNDI